MNPDEREPVDAGQTAGLAGETHPSPEARSADSDELPAAATGRVLRRVRDDKVLGGVCGGLGNYFAIEPVIVRLIFIALAFAGGLGVLLYFAAWMIIPEAGPGEEVGGPAGSDKRSAIVLGVALIAIGVVLLLDRLVPNMDRFLWPLALIAIGVAVLVVGRRRS
jgi:phage shock protein C